MSQCQVCAVPKRGHLLEVTVATKGQLGHLLAAWQWQRGQRAPPWCQAWFWIAEGNAP